MMENLKKIALESSTYGNNPIECFNSVLDNLTKKFNGCSDLTTQANSELGEERSSPINESFQYSSLYPEEQMVKTEFTTELASRDFSSSDFSPLAEDAFDPIDMNKKKVIFFSDVIDYEKLGYEWLPTKPFYEV